MIDNFQNFRQPTIFAGYYKQKLLKTVLFSELKEHFMQVLGAHLSWMVYQNYPMIKD